MANKERGKLSKREYALKTGGSKSSSSSSSSSYKAPKPPKMPSFKFDSKKLLPQYQQEATNLFAPQLQQIQQLKTMGEAQAKDATVRTNEDFAQLLKRESENINRRGAFFSGGAIDQENRIGAQQAGAIRDIGYQQQAANIGYQGQEASIGQAQKDYVSSKVEGAYSSAYKTFQDQVANSMNAYQMQLGQYNQDRTFGQQERAFDQSVIESDRNYALSVAASNRAGASASRANSPESYKEALTGQIYSGELSREAAKQMFKQKFPGQDENWVYNAAPDKYESNIIQSGKAAESLEKPVTAAQARVQSFYSRAADAEGKLQSLSSSINKMGLAGQTQLRYAPNVLKSGNQQQQVQAERQFVEAYLRKDSGAAIPPAEYKDAQRTYFPQPGDNIQTIKAKEQGRQAVISALYTEAYRAQYNVNAPAGNNPADVNDEQLENEFNGN